MRQNADIKEIPEGLTLKELDQARTTIALQCGTLKCYYQSIDKPTAQLDILFNLANEHHDRTLINKQICKCFPKQ